MKQLAVNQLIIKGAPGEAVQLLVKGEVIGTFYPVGAAPVDTPRKAKDENPPACKGHVERIKELEEALEKVHGQSRSLAAALDRGDRYGVGKPYSKADQLRGSRS